MRRSRRGDRGVTIVEASFALPILFLFIFGLIDMGLWTLNSNQAANAARDGARAGVLSYEQADQAGSADRAAIVAAIQQHLPGQDLDDSAIAIECVQAGGTVTPCAVAVPDVDRIRVAVQWEWKLLTPIAGTIGIESGAAEGAATMAIVGRPLAAGTLHDTAYAADTTTTTVPAATCAVGTPTVTPSPVESKGNQLTSDLTVTFTSNAQACSGLRIELVGSRTNPEPTTLSFSCTCGDGPDHTWTYSGSDNVWQQNAEGIVRIFDGSTELAARTFSVT